MFYFTGVAHMKTHMACCYEWPKTYVEIWKTKQFRIDNLDKFILQYSKVWIYMMDIDLHDKSNKAKKKKINYKKL